MTVTESAVKIQGPITPRAPPVFVSHPISPKGTYTQKKAEYLESDLHKQYLKNREQILKDLSENKAEKEAKIAQIDLEIAKI